MSEWHVTTALAEAYAASRLAEPQAWSLEAHVEQCGACARTVSSAADPAVLSRVRRQVLAGTSPRPRGLVRLTVSPAFAASWLVAVVGVLLGVVVLDGLDAAHLPFLLLVAPLLPLLGLALGCAPALDRSAELLASTPVSTLHVLLLRAAAVLTLSLPPLLVVSVVTGVGPLRWLVPTAGLVGLALALTTLLRVEVATASAGAVWVVTVLGPAAVRTGEAPGLRTGSPVAWLLLAALGALVLVVRRDHLESVASGTGRALR